MKTQTLSLLVTFIAWSACLVLSPASARADIDAPTPATQLAPAGQFVQKMGDKALLELTDKAIDRTAREARARQILRQNFDVPTIARFALGPAWREATEGEKREYMQLFENMIVKTYASRFEEYSGQSFKVEGARDDGNGKDWIVVSQIIQKGGPPVKVDWRVRKKDGGMKVVDVIVENISMSQTQRSDFASVIQGGGGKVEALLKSLRDKKAADAESAK